ncbi:MAG TPA: DUF6754 domain-containing protein [Kofleriaceae bacterium]|nr:DUF6754 domain-containing protein [Kofleriaceae bacterium]
MRRALVVLALVAAAVPAHAADAADAAHAADAADAQPLAPVTAVHVAAPPNDDGRHLVVDFARADGVQPDVATLVLRRPHDGRAPAAPAVAPDATLRPGAALGDWTIAALLEGGETSYTDAVSAGGTYDYDVLELRRDDTGQVAATSPPAFAGPASPRAAWFHTDRWPYLLMVAIIAGLFAWYVRLAKRRPQDIYIRRMPGVDAIEDAVGRSTEMGRPVLYVTGIEDVQDIMTIASLLILSHVAELTATYDTEIKVANCYPITMVVAEEVVRAGYAKAGRADAHRPENVLFISAEQFAFAAGVNGIILRDRPATCIYFGRFYGESLLLAETGIVTGAVQIAGTAELTQLPFFVAACDYALIGEELYATSAYLSREPSLLANIKAADGLKLLTMIFIVVGAALATSGTYDLAGKVFR